MKRVFQAVVLIFVLVVVVRCTSNDNDSLFINEDGSQVILDSHENGSFIEKDSIKDSDI